MKMKGTLIVAAMFAGYGAAALATGYGVRGMFAALTAGTVLAMRDAIRRDQTRL